MKTLILVLLASLLSACGGYFIPDKDDMYNQSMAKTKKTAQVDFTQDGFLRSYMSICLPYNKNGFKYLHKKVLVRKDEGSKYSVEKVTASLPINENILINTFGSTTYGGTTYSCNRSFVARLKEGKKYRTHIILFGDKCGVFFTEKNNKGKISPVKVTRNNVPCGKIPDDIESYKRLNKSLE